MSEKYFSLFLCVLSSFLFQLMALNDDLLPDYKQEVPSTPPRIILHYTTFKLTWDWVILILTLYTTVSVPFIVCFAYTGTILAWMDMMVDWMFLADIVLNFHTTYVNKEGDVINDPKMIRMNYIKSWFFVDLVSSLPYGIIFLASKTDDSVSCYLKTCHNNKTRRNLVPCVQPAKLVETLVKSVCESVHKSFF